MNEEIINAIGFGSSPPFDYIASVGFNSKIYLNPDLIKKIKFSHEGILTIEVKTISSIKTLLMIFREEAEWSFEIIVVNCNRESLTYKGSAYSGCMPATTIDNGVTTSISFQIVSGPSLLVDSDIPSNESYFI